MELLLSYVKSDPRYKPDQPRGPIKRATYPYSTGPCWFLDPTLLVTDDDIAYVVNNIEHGVGFLCLDTQLLEQQVSANLLKDVVANVEKLFSLLRSSLTVVLHVPMPDPMDDVVAENGMRYPKISLTPTSPFFKAIAKSATRIVNHDFPITDYLNPLTYFKTPKEFIDVFHCKVGMDLIHSVERDTVLYNAMDSDLRVWRFTTPSVVRTVKYSMTYGMMAMELLNAPWGTSIVPESENV